MDNRIKQILAWDVARWENMTKEALIDELWENRAFFLETELEYGNSEYLDDLISEGLDHAN